jgi:GTP pyrophosphokinase
MVSVTHTFTPKDGHEKLDIQAWIASLSKNFSPDEVAQISHACTFAEPLYDGVTEVTGIPLLQHALGSAAILAGMNMDYETVSAAILHAVPEHLENWQEKLENGFGANIRNLVLGMSRMEQIQDLSDIHPREKSKDDHAQQIESLRKMLLAMVEDIRVVLLKLAERTQMMRHLSGASTENQKLIAREIQGIFAPLANRLGVWQVKWELEDLALRYLEPELYKKIAKLLDARRVEREHYIAEVTAQLRNELNQAGIKAEVTGRSKHINSIVNKMKRKQIDFSELYDVRAVRILVQDIKECYTALGIVHNLWQPIPSEFDDYIAHPKSNDYRSLHTAVVGPRNLALEVQIRTFEMHQHSELGVAAHWRYKEGGKSDAKFDEKIAWLRQILEWKEDVSDSGDMVEQFKSELFQDQVYVLTPQGKVIDLPKGSTPVDFAYILHTDLGHRTRGAKVDGKMVPLNFKLQNGQRVEILAAKQGNPSRDWLNPALGYLQSTRARAKVKHWFKHQNLEENIAQGRTQLDRELHRLGVTAVNQEKIAQRLHFNKLEDLLAALGRSDATTHQVAAAIQEMMPTKVEPVIKPTVHKPATNKAQTSGIMIEGVGNLMTKMAKCCKPAPPDTIVGYVTRDRGVTIHRKDCSAMLRMPENRQDRVLTAQWGGNKDASFAVDIEIVAHDRQGLLRDITDLFAKEKINVTRVNTISKHNQANMQFSLEIADLEQLSKLLTLLHHVPNVVSARRRG